MQSTTAVKVSKRYQVALPSQARQQLNIHAGDRLLVDIQDGLLILVPQPEDFVGHLAGLHADIWAQADPARYLQEERDAWTDSANSQPNMPSLGWTLLFFYLSP